MGIKITVEVPLFLSTFGFMITASINSNLLIYRTCYVILNFNKSECALLGMTSNNVTEHLEKLVQPTSDEISLVKSIVDSIVGSLLCLFLAPWSDRFGRKPILVIGLVGGTLALLFHVLFAAVETLSPWYLMVCSVPVLLTGGGATFMTVLLAYLTDITTKEERGIRMGIFDGIMTLAILLGNTSSSYILAATNYVVVYCIAVICHAFALIFTIMFIEESLRERESENKIAGIFEFTNIVEMLKTPFKSRSQYNRAILLLIILVMSLGSMVIGGEGNLMFLFLREKFQWTLQKFTWYGSANNIIGIVGTILIVYLFHHLLKIKEAVLIFMGFISSFVSLILTGFANKDWQIYLAAVIRIPNSGQMALTRSLMSKLVKEDEIAKIFSAFSIGSSILGPIGSTFYTTLYNATIDADPGVFNFVTAGIVAICLLCFVIILMLQRRSINEEDYSILENESSETDISENQNIDTNSNQDVVLGK